jgi:hypothetical protein
LPVNDVRIALIGAEEDKIKNLENKYFIKVTLDDSLLFGGTYGVSPGGVTSLAIASNGKLVA